jgi:predicted DNA-binding transcriptional regulator AlpA
MIQVNGSLIQERRKENLAERPRIKEATLRPEHPSLLSENGFLRLPQIVGDWNTTPRIPPLVPISKSTLWVWVKAGKFPEPIKLGPRTTVWRVADVRFWLEKQRG